MQSPLAQPPKFVQDLGLAILRVGTGSGNLRRRCDGTRFFNTGGCFGGLNTFCRTSTRTRQSGRVRWGFGTGAANGSRGFGRYGSRLGRFSRTIGRVGGAGSRYRTSDVVRRTLTRRARLGWGATRCCSCGRFSGCGYKWKAFNSSFTRSRRSRATCTANSFTSRSGFSRLSRGGTRTRACWLPTLGAFFSRTFTCASLCGSTFGTCCTNGCSRAAGWRWGTTTSWGCWRSRR